MTPWLSVVLPVHDGERFLGATLASVAAQGPAGVEFLVYDSSDNPAATQALVSEFASRLAIGCTPTPGIKPWQAKVNLGVREARAPQVAILHQDDLWLPGHIEAIGAAIAEAPQSVLSIGPSRFIDEHGRDVGPWRLPFAAGLHPGASIASRLIVQNTIAVPSAVMRRDAWLASGGMNEDLWYTADWDIYLKLAQHGEVMVREPATTAFRLHGSSLTMTGSTDLADFRRQLEIVLDTHASALPPQDLPRLLRMARASIALNCALAEAARHKPVAAWKALRALLMVRPDEIPALLRETRIGDRVRSRLHLLLQRGVR